MTGNQMMDYYVQTQHLYLHIRTCTHSGLCRRPSRLVASLICYLLDRASVSLRTPLMSSCECIIMSFSCLIELYAGSFDISFEPYSPELVSCLAMQSHFIYPSQLDFPFYREGIFPRVSISYTCILAFRIGMFHCFELVSFPLSHSSPPSL